MTNIPNPAKIPPPMISSRASNHLSDKFANKPEYTSDGTSDM